MAILILGGGITKKGMLPKEAKQRVEKAYQVFKRNPQADILACGKYSFLYPKSKLPPRTEAEAIKEYLLELGVPEKKIYLEKKSKDTIGNAYYAKKLYFIPKKDREVWVVTSDFHLERVKFIFEKVFGPRYRLKFFPTLSSFKSKERKNKTIQRQKNLFLKTKSMLSEMKRGDHNFLKNKLYKTKYYREKRPKWVVKFATKGE